MLVLSRHREQTIIIGDDIIITVIDIIKGSTVRLGITAPIDIPVHRQEVYEAIQRGKRGGAPPSEEEVRRALDRQRLAKYDQFEEGGAA